MKKPKPNSAAASKKPVGAPPKALNAGMITMLAMKGNTQEDIAAILGCSVDTIQRNYRHAYEVGLQKCCASLRKKQVKLALDGNVTMLIWLGKNLLGQHDRHELTGKDGAPLVPKVDREEIIGKLLGSGKPAPTARVQ